MKYSLALLLASILCIGFAQGLYSLDASNYNYCIDNNGNYPANVGLIIKSYPVSGVSITISNGVVGTTPYSLPDAYAVYGYNQQNGPFIPFELRGTALGSNVAYGFFKVCPPPKITIVNANLNPVLATPTPTKTYVVSKINPAVIGTISQPALATTTPVAAPVTTTAAIPQDTGSQQQAGTGSLSIATTPSGASIFIDGVQRGVAPATIPGLAPGDHTLLLRLAGYEDLSTPVTVITGTTQQYTTSLSVTVQGAGAPAVTSVPAEQKKNAVPGFGLAAGIAALAGIAFLRRL